MKLQGKVAVVTGAASGFGQGIAERFAAEGAKIVLADINDQSGKSVAVAMADGGADVQYVHTDVTNTADVEAMVAAALDTFGALDILINNAGMPQHNRPMLEIDEATFDAIFATNVKSIFLSAQHAVPVFRERGGGVIINIASTAGLRPRPGLTWYNGSKGAAITLTKSMAVELAPDKIRVNALCPVAGDTPMLDAFLGSNTRDQFVATVPLGRLSTPQDIAGAALFLASSDAEFLTGVCLEVDGGRCI